MKKQLQLIFALMLLLVPTIILAQNTYRNTKVLKKGQESPLASIEDIGWIAGYWTGNGLGGQVEEFWSPPSGGNMSCVFKMVKDSKVSFFELCSISEENNSLMLRLKHFNGDLTGWEEKNETVNFPLVALEDNIAYFDGLTFEMVNSNELNVYVIIGDKDGAQDEMKFVYKRTPID